MEHLLLIDPIAFPGGSKIATSHALALTDPEHLRVTVVTRDPSSWSGRNLRTIPLIEPRLLATREQGIAYFLRHAIILLNILVARLRYGHFDTAVGASGPGVDLSLYLGKRCLGYRIVQLVHGPVARSRTIARALLAADRVFYLESSASSLVSALRAIEPQINAQDLEASERFQAFVNGLPAERWPTPASAQNPRLFWAASLLKWKGLATLLDALQRLHSEARIQTEICYIRPRDTRVELGPEPRDIENVAWHENPPNLDQIRANCSIFVSTSKAEPFGLSILEAMAAGLAVVIPRDGAYWDRVLTDRKHCLKYRPGNASELAERLLELTRNPALIAELASHSRLLAQAYRAADCYASIAAELESGRGKQPDRTTPGSEPAGHAHV